MTPIVLFGNSTVATDFYLKFTHDSDYDVVAFTIDKEYIRVPEFLGLPLVPFEEVQRQFPPDLFGMHVSISYREVNRLRARKYEEARAKGYRLVNYIASSATVWPDQRIGDNCYIGPQVLLNPTTTLGNDVFVGDGSIISHDVVLKDHGFLSSGVTVAGSTTVEEFCFLGAGSVIRDRVTIGRSSVISAGASVLESTSPQSVLLARSAEKLPITSDELTLK